MPFKRSIMLSIDFRELIILRTITSTRRIICTREQKMRTKSSLRNPLRSHTSLARHRTKEIKRSTGDHLPLKMCGWKFESPRQQTDSGLLPFDLRPTNAYRKKGCDVTYMIPTRSRRPTCVYNLTDNATDKVSSFVRPLA